MLPPHRDNTQGCLRCSGRQLPPADQAACQGAETDEHLQALRAPLNSPLAVIGLSLLIYSVRQLFISWNAVDKPATALQFALPIWLTSGILPYVYLLSLFSNYQSAFHAIDVHSDDRRERLRAKLVLHQGTFAL
jgi:hypothetical protein